MITSIPKGIGPHEGQELKLMLCKKKPLAIFSTDYPNHLEHPEIKFRDYVAQGRFIRGELSISQHIKHIYFSQPSENWRINRMIEIDHHLFILKQPTSECLEREIGELLGYPLKTSTPISFGANTLNNA